MTRPHFVVRLRLLGASEGGRRQPIFSGYRPQAWFGETTADGTRLVHGVQVELLDRASLEPGNEANATLTPFFPELWPRRTVGDQIPIYEGRSHVADAVISEVNL